MWQRAGLGSNLQMMAAAGFSVNQVASTLAVSDAESGYTFTGITAHVATAKQVTSSKQEQQQVPLCVGCYYTVPII